MQTKNEKPDPKAVEPKSDTPAATAATAQGGQHVEGHLSGTVTGGPATDAEPTKAYRLVKNHPDQGKHSHNGKPVQVGDVLQLTERQARAFADRFEPVAEAEPRKSSTSDENRDSEPSRETPEPRSVSDHTTQPAPGARQKAQDDGAKTPFVGQHSTPQPPAGVPGAPPSAPRSARDGESSFRSTGAEAHATADGVKTAGPEGKHKR